MSAPFKQPVFYAVDESRVNIDDLINVGKYGPGAIVRVEGPPADSIVPIPLGSVFLQSWGCVYCKAVMTWRVEDPPPQKCTSCGAPRRA